MVSLDTREAEAAFGQFIAAVKSDDTAKIAEFAPFFDAGENLEQEAAKTFFQLLANADAVYRYQRTGRSKCAVTVRIPADNLTLEFELERVKDGWKLLPNWKQIVTIDSISLD